jgi:hypothetical protein
MLGQRRLQQLLLPELLRRQHAGSGADLLTMRMMASSSEYLWRMLAHVV